MNTLIDNLEHEITLLPSNNKSCEIYLWDSKIVTNKQIKEYVNDKLKYCRTYMGKEGCVAAESLYLLFPISIRQL